MPKKNIYICIFFSFFRTLNKLENFLFIIFFSFSLVLHPTKTLENDFLHLFFFHLFFFSLILDHVVQKFLKTS